MKPTDYMKYFSPTKFGESDCNLMHSTWPFLVFNKSINSFKPKDEERGRANVEVWQQGYKDKEREIIKDYSEILDTGDTWTRGKYLLDNEKHEFTSYDPEKYRYSINKGNREGFNVLIAVHINRLVHVAIRADIKNIFAGLEKTVYERIMKEHMGSEHGSSFYRNSDIDGVFKDRSFDISQALKLGIETLKRGEIYAETSIRCLEHQQDLSFEETASSVRRSLEIKYSWRYDDYANYIIAHLGGDRFRLMDILKGPLFYSGNYYRACVEGIVYKRLHYLFNRIAEKSIEMLSSMA